MPPEEENEFMKKLLDQITAAVSGAFEAAGYEADYGKVTLSNRPDLCEYQCNGAMAGAKKYRCAPIQIASQAAERLQENAMFSEVSAVNPGFLNLKLSPDFVRDYLQAMQELSLIHICSAFSLRAT